MKTDFVPWRTKPYPISGYFFFDWNRGNLYPISDQKGVKNHCYPLVPLTPPVALRKHYLGLGLATITLKS